MKSSKLESFVYSHVGLHVDIPTTHTIPIYAGKTLLLVVYSKKIG